MDNLSGKKKDSNQHLPPWKQPMTVRPEILAAFQKWNDDPESVYEGDKLRKSRVAMASGKNRIVDFVIPELMKRRQNTMVEPTSGGHRNKAGGRKKHSVKKSLEKKLSNSSHTTTHADSAGIGWEHSQSTTSHGSTTTATRAHDDTKSKSRKTSKNEELVLIEVPEVDVQTARYARPMSPVNVLVPMSVFSHVNDVIKHGTVTMEQRIHEQNIQRMMAVNASMTKTGTQRTDDAAGAEGVPAATGGAARANSPRLRPKNRLEVGGRDLTGSSTESLGCTSRDLVDAKSIHFGVCCLADSRQVRIRDIRCDALADGRTSSNDIHPFLKLYMTSSVGAATPVTRTTSVLMATKEPRFDDVIYFAFPPDRFNKLSLEIEICSRIDPAVNGGVKLLGGAAVTFSNMEIGPENHVTEEIQDALKDDEDADDEFPVNALCIEVCFQAKEGQLSLIIERASAVHADKKQSMLDSYVTIGLSQPGKTLNKARTLIQKNSSDPVFDEKFVFNISPKIDDLRYTSISISLKQRRQMRSDKTIGQVKFGSGSTQQTEAEHWHTVLQNPGISCKRWHALFDKQ